MARGFRSPARIARRLTLTRLASQELENWPAFMYHYALGLVPAAPYRFRGGPRLQIGRGVDHVPIIETFLRKDYGEIPRDTVVVDLGANIGTFAIYAATSAPGVRVHAYEPAPAFFRLLENNVRLNGLHGAVRCFNLAVAGDTSDRELFLDASGLYFPTLIAPESPATASARVRCVDLARVLRDGELAHVDILKMDVEGAEYDILAATAQEVWRSISEVRMEYHNLDRERRNVARLKQLLTSQGFAITREHASTATHGTLWARQ